LIFLFPIFLLAANIVSKLIFLSSQPVQLDEPFSIYHAQFQVSGIIQQLKNYNNPPLFEIILHFWIKLFGISTLSVRLLPFIFAWLCPIALFYFAKQHFSISIALCSSALLSCSSLLVFYAQDCRVYSLFLLLTIWSMHYFLKIIQQVAGKFNPLFFITSSLLLVYAHYFGIYVLFLQLIFLFTHHRKQLKQFLGYYTLIIILYLPHLYVLFTRMKDSVQSGTWLKTPDGVQSLYNMLWSYSNAPVVTVICLIILLSALVKNYFKKSKVNVQTNIHVILYWFLFSFFGLFFISYWVPVYISRYLLFVIPSYYILLGVCLDNLFLNTKIKYCLMLCLVLIFAASAKLKPDKKHDAVPAIRLLSTLKTSETLVVVFPKDFLPTFTYHYNPLYFSSLDERSEYGIIDSLLRNDNIFFVNAIEDLSQINISKFKKIISLTAGIEPTTVELINQLNTRYQPVGTSGCKDNFNLNFFRTR